MRAHRIAMVAAMLALMPGGASAAARVPKVFRPFLNTLSWTHVPILLPTYFGPAKLDDPKVIFVRASASADHYEVQLNDADMCNGANVCSEGSIRAGGAAYRARLTPDEAISDPVLDPGPRKPAKDDLDAIRAHREIFDHKVALAGGLVGYYSEFISGASAGGNSYLRFVRNGIVYSIATRISDQATLVRIANSMIENGVVHAVHHAEGPR